MRPDDDSRTTEGIERDLDGILPEGVDRRGFLTATAVSIGAALAGCSGGGDGGDGGSGGTTAPSTTSSAESGSGTESGTSGEPEELIRNAIWRSPWKAEPMYSVSYVSQLKGYWADERISAPAVQTGYGSGDTAKRIGTGKENLGMAEITPQVPGFAEGYNMKIYGAGTPRTILALIYRADVMESGTDLENKTVVSESALTDQSWPLYADAVDAPDSVELTHAKESVTPGMLAKGEADAIWGTIDDFGPFDARSDLDLAVEPLYKHIPIYGNTLLVNGDWLEGENNFEYTRRLLEGYSKAGKWALLNPVDTVEMMRQNVNQALQTTDKEILVDNMRAGTVATNLSSEIEANGFGYLSREKLDRSLTKIAGLLDVEAPSVEAAANFDIQSEAELATFSKDEWSHLEEWAQPYTDSFRSG